MILAWEPDFAESLGRLAARRGHRFPESHPGDPGPRRPPTERHRAQPSPPLLARRLPRLPRHRPVHLRLPRPHPVTAHDPEPAKLRQAPRRGFAAPKPCGATSSISSPIACVPAPRSPTVRRSAASAGSAGGSAGGGAMRTAWRATARTVGPSRAWRPLWASVASRRVIITAPRCRPYGRRRRSGRAGTGTTHSPSAMAGP